MKISKILNNTLLVLITCFLMTACASKKVETTGGEMQGDVYIGTDSVEYLAEGVKDRVFFATNESILTTASRETLRAQAAWLRKNSSINVVLEGHADERGTREYNLALGDKRAFAVYSYLAQAGVDTNRMDYVSWGKERPEVIGSDETAYGQNRRGVTIVSN